MDDFDLDFYEKYIDIKNSSVARLGRQILKENNQHERIKKILNMTRYCLYEKIRKMENLLDKYELKKGKKAKEYVTQGYMGMGVPIKLKFTFLSNI
jgi:hypothetical protein